MTVQPNLLQWAGLKPAPAWRADPVIVRRLLDRPLAKLRAAAVMPWDAAELSGEARSFASLCLLTPEEEDARHRAAFLAELHRLGVEADPLPTREEADPVVVPSEASVRSKIQRMLSEIRTRPLPWSERTLRFNQVIFPQMCNWLADEEADRMRAAFAGEIVRLAGETMKAIQTA